LSSGSFAQKQNIFPAADLNFIDRLRRFWLAELMNIRIQPSYCQANWFILAQYFD
jgi:hypothetical protein